MTTKLDCTPEPERPRTSGAAIDGLVPDSDATPPVPTAGEVEAPTHPKASGRPRAEGSRFVRKTSSGELSIERVLCWDVDRSWEAQVTWLPRTGDRPAVYCPFCGQRGLYRHTDKRHHFAHANGASACAEGALESALHRHAKRVILEGLRAAREARTSVDWTVTCVECDSTSVRPFLLAESWSAETEEQQCGAYKLDVAAYGALNVIGAIEVKKTHATTEEKLAALSVAAIPCVEVRACDLVDELGSPTWDGRAPLPPAVAWRVRGDESPFRCEACMRRRSARLTNARALVESFAKLAARHGIYADDSCSRCQEPVSWRCLANDLSSSFVFDDGTNHLASGAFVDPHDGLPLLGLRLVEGRRVASFDESDDSLLTLVMTPDEMLDTLPETVVQRRGDHPGVADGSRSNTRVVIPLGCLPQPRRRSPYQQICRRCRVPSEVATEVDTAWAWLLLRDPDRAKAFEAGLARVLGIAVDDVRAHGKPIAIRLDSMPEAFAQTPGLQPLALTGFRLPEASSPIALLAQALGEPSVKYWKSVRDFLERPHRALVCAIGADEKVTVEHLAMADRVLAPEVVGRCPLQRASWAAFTVSKNSRQGNTVWPSGRSGIGRSISSRREKIPDLPRREPDPPYPTWVDAAVEQELLVQFDRDGMPAFACVGHHANERALAQMILQFISRWTPSHDAVHRATPLGTNADEQDRAVELAMSAPISLIVGGAGTGKSTAVRKLLDATPETRWLLTAPTGKAASRLREATRGHGDVVDAVTVHKAFHPANKYLLKTADALVIDEAGFLDVETARQLFEAVLKSRTVRRVVFVGDPQQLPSVQPGAVLRDLLAARTQGKRRTALLPREQLKTGRRSNERIVRFANSVLKGKPTFADATLVESDDASTPARIEEIVQQLRAAGRSDNVQILAATRNLVGEINRRLRLPLPVGEKRVRAVHGDRVIVTKNSYDRQKPNRTVLNGEVGTLHIQTKDGETTFSIEIAHDDVRGPFPIQEIKMLDLAYAMTIHKSQGSEWDIVILAVPEQRWQLSRPLLYTAATRARSEFILVGCKASVSNAASRSPARSTALRVLLERDAPAALPLQPPSDVARSSESRCQPDELGDPA